MGFEKHRDSLGAASWSPVPILRRRCSHSAAPFNDGGMTECQQYNNYVFMVRKMSAATRLGTGVVPDYGRLFHGQAGRGSRPPCSSPAVWPMPRRRESTLMTVAVVAMARATPAAAQILRTAPWVTFSFRVMPSGPGPRIRQLPASAATAPAQDTREASTRTAQ